MSYDRDAVAARITRHYELLVWMAYLDPAVIQRSPPKGWSDDQLAVDYLREMNCTEKVIDLLRHLPYIREDLGDEDWEVYSLTQPIRYLRDSLLVRGKTVESFIGKGLENLGMMLLEGEHPAGMISWISRAIRED